MEEILHQLEWKVKELFHNDSSGHDIYHLKRTLNAALTLQEKEGGDRLIIAVAAFLHDIHRIIKNDAGTYCSPKESLPKIKELLDTTNLSDNQKEKILHCIEFHEEYDFSEHGKTAQDIETLILQDADNLDAIGAIGIGRTFSYSGAHGRKMWIPEESFDKKKFNEGEEDPSTIHHFHSKLLKLKDNMNTATAKEIANKRHQFMELFLQEFFDEWAGKK